jgi:imidazolonepropionase-like amidohydrolase
VIAALKSPAYAEKAKSDPNYERNVGMLDMAQRNLRRTVEAGVKIAMGTDSGVPARFPGFFEHLEMELMSDAGMTAPDIIAAATRNGAEFIGARDIGTLAPGKWADLLVLSRNPLEDIRNTRTIDSVYIAGNKVKSVAPTARAVHP